MRTLRELRRRQILAFIKPTFLIAVETFDRQILMCHVSCVILACQQTRNLCSMVSVRDPHVSAATSGNNGPPPLVRICTYVCQVIILSQTVIGSSDKSLCCAWHDGGMRVRLDPRPIIQMYYTTVGCILITGIWRSLCLAGTRKGPSAKSGCVFLVRQHEKQAL